jgi:D-alanine-D-alanine ligase-like ATP-grasp enzyme
MAGSQEMKDLRNIVIVYEDRDTWIKKTASKRLSEKAREELSYWLVDKWHVEESHRTISKVARKHGVQTELTTIDEFTKNFQSLSTGRRKGRTLVWNITDGHVQFKGSHVPSLAILAGIPYFGCPPYAQALAQDKFKLFLLCRAIGVPTPQSALADGGVIVSSFLEETHGPYFVKPNSFGNKIGLDKKSMQSDLAGAAEQSAKISRRYGSQAVIQEFIAGPEVRFTFINANAGNDVRIPTFGYDVVNALEWQAGTPTYISAEERASAYHTGWHDLWTWRGLSEEKRVRTIKYMTAAVTLLSRYVRLKDYFTVDFRIDPHGVPRLIDFNSGAFLYGPDVEGYAQQNLHMPLPEAIFSAMQNSFTGRHPSVFSNTENTFSI